MFLSLSKIKDDRAFELKGDLNDSWLVDACSDLSVNVKSFSFKLLFNKKRNFIEVSGSFKSLIEFICVRCLKTFDKTISDENLRLFIYKEGLNNTKELQLEEKDLDFSFMKGDSIDIAELLREQLIVNMPDYPLCNASCKCSCNSSVDSQNVCKNVFSKLKNLKLKD